MFRMEAGRALGAREGDNAEASRKGQSADIALAPAPTQRFVRLAVLAALLLLALYTAIAVVRLMGEPQSPSEQLLWLMAPLGVAFALGVGPEWFAPKPVLRPTETRALLGTATSRSRPSRGPSSARNQDRTGR